MATKKELFEGAMEIAERHQLPAEAVAELKALLEPKKGGGKFEIDDVACRDEDGTVTYILDSVLKVWVPVYDAEGEPNFYEKPDTELGWSRFSRTAEKARKDAEKQYKATKDAVLKDLLAGEIDQESAKETMEAAEVARKTYELPENFTYEEERPCPIAE